MNSKLDYTGIVAENPVQLQVSGTFFLGDVFILILLAICFPGRVMESRLFNWIRRVKAFENVDQVVIDRNSVNGMAMRSTVAKDRLMETERLRPFSTRFCSFRI